MKHLKLIILWLLVALPLGWGVAKSMQKSRPLFAGTTMPADPAPPH
jgi:hypothetical protein